MDTPPITQSSTTSSLARHSILEGPFWPEPVRVVALTHDGDRVQVEAVGRRTETFYASVFDAAEFVAKVRLVADALAPTFTGQARHFALALEAERIRLAYEVDPHFALSVSQVDALPHQLDAVYHVMLRSPRVRFLLADDPGAGKTIMAGLLLKELKLRGLAERMLVVAPASLTALWQRELRQRFGETFTVVDRGTLGAFLGEKAWEARAQCITSLDFAKQAAVLDTLRGVRWDVVVVDEAHRMAAYQYGQDVKKTDRYQLGELLAAHCDHLLFLTATPHKGDPANFLLLLRLLDPDLYASVEVLRQAVRAGESPIFLRRMKEDMVGFDGKPLFPPRQAITPGYRLSPAERLLYDAVTDYVQDHFQRAFQEDNRNVQLALTVLQRRLASSVRAIRRSLERRRAKLAELRQLGRRLLEEPRAYPADPERADLERLEDLPELERWRIEDEAVARFTVARDVGELDTEIAILDELLALAWQAELAGTERKLEELRALMQQEDLFHTAEKLLIFTEARDTLDYLVEKLGAWGFTVTQIHGQMPMAEREAAEAEFEHRAQVMVATEAAGEGINLQFCHLVVNYDIPWNPNRLEQRMGRVHRYGQDREVFIYNLVATDTREGAVLAAILNKLEAMRRDLGDRVFDVVGNLVTEIRLEQLLREALARRRSFEEIRHEVEVQLDNQTLERLRTATLDALATRHIDLSRLAAEQRAAREERLMPEVMERFFVEGLRALGGRIEARGGTWRIEWLPAHVRELPDAHKRRFGVPATTYRALTFRKPDVPGLRPPGGSDRPSTDPEPAAEFIAPGHPLFEAVAHHVRAQFGPVLAQGAVFLDPSATESRCLWFLRGTVRDGRGDTVGERIFAMVRRAGDGLTWQAASPSVLADLIVPAEPIPAAEVCDAGDQTRAALLSAAYSALLDPYFAQVQGRRLGELELKERYVRRSLDYLISLSNRKLGEFYARRRAGEAVTRALDEEQKRRDQLVRRRDARLAEIEQARHLSRRPLELLGVAAVLPAPAPTDADLGMAMRRDEAIEEIAMRVALDYERAHGRLPEDVSAQDLGFDLRSTSVDGVRTIEVKGRAAVGSVSLTRNEWIKAQRFGAEYWLYIVVNCATEPELYRIQDPAARLRPEERLEVRYIVPADEWREVAGAAAAG